MAKRRMLLLGASGYLGTQISTACKRDQAWSFAGTCCSIPKDGLIRLDVTDEQQVRALLAETMPEVVIWSLMSGTDEWAVMQKGLTALLDHLPQRTKLLFLSTDGIFGQGTGHFSEEAQGVPLDDRNPLSVYTNAKLWGEKLIRERHGNHVIVRVGPIYGKNSSGMWDKRVSAFREQLENGAHVYRPGNLYKTFIHVEDGAAAIHELSSGSFTGTLHVGPLQKESYFSFHQKIAKSLGWAVELLKESAIAEEESRERGVPLDTSLDTMKATRLLATTFRNVGDERITLPGEEDR